MSKSRLSAARKRVESYPERARQRYPVVTALAGLSFRGLERVGARATGSRVGRTSVLALVALVLVTTPVAAQVSCGSGILGFIMR